MSPAGGPQTLHEQHIEHVTCLGCGCACDDIGVRVSEGRIIEARNACPLGLAWFGDGTAPSDIRVHRPASGTADAAPPTDAGLDAALDATATLLLDAHAPLIYLAPELACEAQREAIAVADVLHATIDSVTSGTAMGSILAAQERGRAAATLGEIRHRADAVVFWAVDPAARYPRYWTRYAPEPAGLYVDGGRRGRTVIAVDVGTSRGPADADVRVSVDPSREVAVLTTMTAMIRKPGITVDATLDALAQPLVSRLSASRYVTIVADAEPDAPDGGDAQRDPQRASALIALTQALNGPTRAALSSLRGGGNRVGADAMLTAQTGYPAAVSFVTGFPSYRPSQDAFEADAVLVVGDAAQVPGPLSSRLAQVPHAIVGPRATSRAPRVAIDTGVAGIHLGGTALRLDDVPLPLRPVVTGHRDPADVLRALQVRLAARLRQRAAAGAGR